MEFGRHIFLIEGSLIALDGAGTKETPFVLIGARDDISKAAKACSMLVEKLFDQTKDFSEFKMINLPSGRSGAATEICGWGEVFFDLGEANGDGPSPQPKPAFREASELTGADRDALLNQIRKNHSDDNLDDEEIRLELKLLLSDSKTGLTDNRDGILKDVPRKGASPQSVHKTTEAPAKPPPQPAKTGPFKLLSLMDFPSMPAPWSSESDGETWVFGDFFMTLQEKPITLAESINKMTGGKLPPIPMTYPYALTVFYRYDRNPNGPSFTPIMVFTLEQMDLGALTGAGQPKGIGSTFPIMSGAFVAGQHVNYGDYSGALSKDSVRQHLFGLMKQELGIDADPKFIGTLSDAFEHPETGLPARKESTKTKADSGCLGAVIVIAGVLGAASLLPSLFS